jgi:hypothetical protein
VVFLVKYNDLIYVDFVQTVFAMQYSAANIFVSYLPTRNHISLEALQPRSVDSGYFMCPSHHLVNPLAARPPNQCADIALISASLPNPSALILIAFTLAAHNRHHGGPDFSVGTAAIIRTQYVQPYI